MLVHEFLNFLRANGCRELKTPLGIPYQKTHQQILTNPYELSKTALRELLELGYPFAPADRRFLLHAFRFEASQSATTTTKAERNWLCKIRRKYTEGILEARHISFMESLGVIWNLDEVRWKRDIETLRNMRKVSVRCYAYESAQMRGFMNRIRQRRSTLSAEQIKELDDVGFIWTPADDLWNLAVTEIEAYQKKYGHGNIPRDNKEFPTAGTFLAGLRPAYRWGKIPEERVKKLESLGVFWEPVKEIWEFRYRQLKKIFERDGKVENSKLSEENPELGCWLRSLHANWRVLSREKKKRLEAIGVVKIRANKRRKE